MTALFAGIIAFALGMGVDAIPQYETPAIEYTVEYTVEEQDIQQDIHPMLNRIVFAFIGATPIMKNVCSRIKASEVVETVVLIVLLVVVTAYLIDGSFNPFLYFRF